MNFSLHVGAEYGEHSSVRFVEISKIFGITGHIFFGAEPMDGLYTPAMAVIHQIREKGSLCKM